MAAAVVGAVAMIASGAFGATSTSDGTLNMVGATHLRVQCPGPLTNAAVGTQTETLYCAPAPAPTPTSTTVAPVTTTVAPVTTTVAPVTTTTAPSKSGTCTSPTYTTSSASGSTSPDGNYWWVNNDAWNGGAGPQTLNVCSQSSWTAISNQTNQGGAVETYPDTEYDVGGRNTPSTKPISGYPAGSITATFAESFPTGTGEIWDAAFDLWTNNWSNETMIWNQWQGAQDYWVQQANGPGGYALTLAGVPYHFFANGSELMFFRDTQVAAGSVDIAAAFQWEVAHGFASASDVPTQLEYGVEICATPGPTAFPVTGLTFTVG